MDIFRTKNDIPRKYLDYFLRVNVTFYDAVKMIHGVITTAAAGPVLVNFSRNFKVG